MCHNVIILRGPFVRKPINANPGLTLIKKSQPRFPFSLFKKRVSQLILTGRLKATKVRK